MAEEKKRRKEIRREHSIAVRLNDEEYNYFIEQVKLSGLSKGEYLRRCIKMEKVISIPYLKDFIMQLSKIGNNINQIARNVNSHTEVNQVYQMRQQLKGLQRIADNLLELMGGERSGNSKSGS